MPSQRGYRNQVIGSEARRRSSGRDTAPGVLHLEALMVGIGCPTPTIYMSRLRGSASGCFCCGDKQTLPRQFATAVPICVFRVPNAAGVVPHLCPGR